MPSAELTYWQAFYGIEPFGTTRDNFHAGIIASTFANAHSKKTWSPNDFMLKTSDQKREDNGRKFLAGLARLSSKKNQSESDQCQENES